MEPARPPLPDDPTPHRPRKALLLTAKVAVSAAILYVILSKVSVTEIHADLTEIAWTPFLLGLLLTVPNMLIQHWKWRYLVRIVHPPVTGHEAFRSLMGGFAMGLVTPGRLGEIGRGLFIPSAPKSIVTGMAIIDKVMSQGALAVLGAAGLWYFIGTVPGIPGVLTWVLAVTAAGIVSFNVIVRTRPDLLRNWIRNSKRIFYGWPHQKKLFDLISASEQFKKTHFWPSVGYAFVFQAVILLQFYFFVNAFDRLDLVPSLAATAAAMFIKSLLPIAIMDLGVREGAVVYCLTLLGVNPASAFNASVMIFFSNVLWPGLVGLIYFVKASFWKTADARR